MIIDQNTCTHCGLCLKICSRVLLYGTKDGQLPNENACVRCGQCQAVCPTGALRMESFEINTGSLCDRSLLPTPASEKMAILTRRSTRTFQRKPVDESVLADILDAGAYAPSGGNLHPISIVVVQDPAQLDWLRERAWSRLQEKAEQLLNSEDPVLRGKGRYFASFCAVPSSGSAKDRMLFQAPALLLSVGEPQHLREAATTMATMERMVYAHGLGGVYCGFFTNAVNGDPEVQARLGLTGQEEVLLSYALGIPKYSYRGIPPRHPLKIKRL